MDVLSTEKSFEIKHPSDPTQRMVLTVGGISQMSGIRQVDLLSVEQFLREQIHQQEIDNLEDFDVDALEHDKYTFHRDGSYDLRNLSKIVEIKPIG